MKTNNEGLFDFFGYSLPLEDGTVLKEQAANEDVKF